MEAEGSDQFLSQNKSNPDLGLGLDWGVLFSRTDLVYAALKSDEVKEDTEAPPKTCEILEKKKKYLKGFCSAHSSCVMGSVQYFCHGLSVGEPCTVVTTE